MGINVGHIFSGTIDFFKKTVHKVSSVTAKDAENVANEVQKWIPMAVTVAKVVDAMVPNRTTEEFIALAAKYQLHVNDEILKDPIQLEGLVQNAAMKEMLHLADKNAEHNILRSALNLGVSWLRLQNA